MYPLEEKKISRDFYKKIIEALLFCAGRPLKIKEIQDFFSDLSFQEIEDIISELIEEYKDRGLRVNRVSGGYRIETAPEIGIYLKKFFQPTGFKWSKALLETLAIIAYYQPISRAEISEKRGGVEVGLYIKTLLERGFIKVVGRKPVPGKPPLYGTTSFFLEYFGLNSLEELPPLSEIEKLFKT